jgi:hypothetical protein
MQQLRLTSLVILEQFQLCANITDDDDGVKLKETIQEDIQQYYDRDMTIQIIQ